MAPDMDGEAVNLISRTFRQKQVGYEYKWGQPNQRHQVDDRFYRAHARPRHDRWTKSALILSIAKQKMLCAATFVLSPLSCPNQNRILSSSASPARNLRLSHFRLIALELDP
jgi:hypothetical protein